VAGPDWSFEVECLTGSLQRDAEWKRRHGFPEEVEGVASVVDEDLAWRNVVLDYPERLPVALLLTGDGEADRLLGFAVRAENWSLQSNDPVLTLEEWRDIFPQLAGDPSTEQWSMAWRGWCQPRNLPESQTAGCVLERRENVLRVHAQPRLLERLRGARNDSVRGETWILAGDGPFRRAALLEIVAAKQEKTAGPL
jgi:hypothetical protein